MGSKAIITIGTILVLVVGIGLVGVAVEAQGENTPEIDQNQVEDKISRTIIIQLQDGIRSSDGIN